MQIGFKERGKVYYTTEDYPAAINDWSKSLELKGDYLFSILSLSVAYYVQGDNENWSRVDSVID